MTGLRVNKRYLLKKKKKRGRGTRVEWKGGNKREEKGRKKGENFFLFGGSTRSADVAVAARSKSLGSVDGKRLRCRGSAAGRTPEEFDRFTCQVKTQRPRITRLYFRDMPSVGRYANRGLLSSIDTLSVDRFRVLLLVRQSRSRALGSSPGDFRSVDEPPDASSKLQLSSSMVARTFTTFMVVRTETLRKKSLERGCWRNSAGRNFANAKALPLAEISIGRHLRRYICKK